MMGLLDGFRPAGWRGLLNAPILQPPPDMTSSRMPPAGPADETAEPPKLTAPTLRMKGVSESDIAAALDSPAVMQQLVNRNFGPGANSATDNRYPDQAFNPQTNAIDDDRAHSDAPRLFNAFQADPDRNAPGSKVQLAQYAPASPTMPLPMPGGVFLPGTRENQEFTRDFIHAGIGAGRALGDAIGNIFHNENVVRPPAGSRSIDKTPWSGDHTEIKNAVGAKANSDVRISPTGEVWAQHPDGSWTNHGPASVFTGSGKPGGRRGKDRDQR
jgi:hypothetical protein